MTGTILIAAILLSVCGCSRPGPTSTVKQYLASAEKGDVDAMIMLYSSKATQKLGAEVIRADSKFFSDQVMKARARGEILEMFELREQVNGDVARVSFIYQDSAKVNSVDYGFDLSKEAGSWRIDEIGSPSAKKGGEETSAVTPPAADRSNGPVSGGVLNDKATKLPQPSYPAVARSAQATGQVTVQVLVDEKGKVIDAKGISGHPMLQPAAIAAARQAEFKPTLVDGKPVKVSGTIIYDFSGH